MKVALIHDDFCQLGGAERLFEEIARIFPEAPVYTSIVDWKKLPATIGRNRVRPSFIQKIPFAKKFYKALLPLYPFAFESLDLSDYDVVISSTTRFAKSVITKPSTAHISYVNSVPRFLYDQEKKSNYLPKFLDLILTPYFNWIRRWDKVSASRVDEYLANSKNVQKDIKKIYGRESRVVYPAVDTEFFKEEGKHRDYFLIVSRLVKWKKLEMAIKASIELGINLKIVGSGPDKSRLRSVARGKVEFFESVDKEKLRTLYQGAKALIVTQDEDFGIASVEAQACGTPVIAFGSGGSLETIVSGKTGLFYKEQNVKSLKRAIQTFSRVKWVRSECRQKVLEFSKETFSKNLQSQVKYAFKNH